MIDIKEIKKKQEEAYRKRFERWYKKSQIEQKIEILALKGYRSLTIEIRNEPVEKIKLMKKDKNFIQLLNEKLPDFSITRRTYDKIGVFGIPVNYDYITIAW